MIQLDRDLMNREVGKAGFYNHLYQLAVAGKTINVLPRELQMHPVTDAIMHVDFLAVKADTSVTVNVPVVFLNEEECPGLVRGGVLNIVRHEIEVNCRPTPCRESIVIDLTGLDIGDSIHIGSVSLASDVVPTIDDRDFTIATIAAPTVITEEEEAGEEAEEGSKARKARKARAPKATATSPEAVAPDARSMLLLVGLGNPGPDHARQRHNIGFMAADRIADDWGFNPWRRRFQGDTAEGRLDGHKVLVLKPLTFMNDPVVRLARPRGFSNWTPTMSCVLYDEIDLAPAKVRCKQGGGHAGHNGIRSVHAHIGPDYRRVRIGVGHPGDKDRVIGHVLSSFSSGDKAWLDPLLDAISDSAPLLAKHQDEKFSVPGRSFDEAAETEKESRRWRRDKRGRAWELNAASWVYPMSANRPFSTR